MTGYGKLEKFLSHSGFYLNKFEIFKQVLATINQNLNLL